MENEKYYVIGTTWNEVTAIFNSLEEAQNYIENEKMSDLILSKEIKG